MVERIKIWPCDSNTMQPDPRFQQQPGYVGTNPYAPQQNVVVVDPANQQQYIQGVPGQQAVMMVPQKPPQDALITISYVVSAIGILFFPICLGPIGFICALVANSNGDSRGVNAMAFAAIATVIGMILGFLVFTSLS